MGKASRRYGSAWTGRRVLTPFGGVSLPDPKDLKPALGLPRLDPRRRAVVKQAIAVDGATLFGYIPLVGNIINDYLEDLHGPEILANLTEEERVKFLRYDKALPLSTLAVLRTFIAKA